MKFNDAMTEKGSSVVPEQDSVRGEVLDSRSKLHVVDLTDDAECSCGSPKWKAFREHTCTCYASLERQVKSVRYLK